MEVGGEVGPGWVELAQLVGKKNVWPVAWRRKISIFKILKSLHGRVAVEIILLFGFAIFVKLNKFINK